MAKTDWQMGDTVLPDDMNQIGQEINDAASTAVAAQATANSHASRHAAGGPDEITPEMIGAVKRSGDTIIGSLVVHDGSNYRNIAVKRDRPGGEVGEIRLEVDSAAGGNVYVTRTINNEISGRLTLRDNAILFNSNTIWHAGNDGAGSGLDADTVRGYIPANKAGDNFTGNINITGSGDRGIDFGNSPKTAGAIGIFPGWGDRLYINIHSASGAKAVTRSSGVEIGGPVYVEGVNKVWHAGNLPIEYGTFTPQFRYGPPASSTPGDTTYSYQVGRYQRIGDRVFFDLYVKLSSRDPYSGTRCQDSFLMNFKG